MARRPLRFMSSGVVSATGYMTPGFRYSPCVLANSSQARCRQTGLGASGRARDALRDDLRDGLRDANRLSGTTLGGLVRLLVATTFRTVLLAASRVAFLTAFRADAFLAMVFLAVDFRATPVRAVFVAGFRAVARFVTGLRAEDFRAADFLAKDLLDAFLEDFFAAIGIMFTLLNRRPVVGLKMFSNKLATGSR
jgi:hypothetical protein